MTEIRTTFRTTGVEDQSSRISDYNLTDPKTLMRTIFSPEWPVDANIEGLYLHYNELWEQNHTTPVSEANDDEFEKFVLDVDFSRFLLSYHKFLIEKLNQLRDCLSKFSPNQIASYEQIESHCLKSLKQILVEKDRWEWHCPRDFQVQNKRKSSGYGESTLYERVDHLTNSLRDAFHDLLVLSRALQAVDHNVPKVPREQQIEEILKRNADFWPRSLEDIRRDLIELDDLTTLCGLGQWGFTETFGQVLFMNSDG